MNELETIYLSTNLFENRKMKLIDQMPEGDTYFVFWIQLLCLAGKTGCNGWVMLTENRTYTAKELGIVTGIPENTVVSALKIFDELRMIRLIGNRILIRNWKKYQFPMMEEEVE